jgi:hypothetical protein
MQQGWVVPQDFRRLRPAVQGLVLSPGLGKPLELVLLLVLALLRDMVLSSDPVLQTGRGLSSDQQLQLAQGLSLGRERCSWTDRFPL